MTNLSHEQTLAELTAKIVEAVPEINETCSFCRMAFTFCPCNKFDPPRPITLEDVLRALHQKDGWWSVDTYGDFHRADEDRDFATWQLGKSLSDQPAETVLFLHSLLCK